MVNEFTLAGVFSSMTRPTSSLVPVWIGLDRPASAPPSFSLSLGLDPLRDSKRYLSRAKLFAISSLVQTLPETIGSIGCADVNADASGEGEFTPVSRSRVPSLDKRDEGVLIARTQLQIKHRRD